MLFNTDSQQKFERDPRRQQEIKMRPAANRIYRQFFSPSSIKRNHNLTLDKEHAVDVILTCPNGMVITGQEKFLSYKYAHFQSLTVEYRQNQFTDEEGDWFKLAPQIYFCGYCNQQETQFASWVIVNWVNLVIATNYYGLQWRENTNQDGSARASFRYIAFEDIPSNCIMASFGFGE